DRAPLRSRRARRPRGDDGDGRARLGPVAAPRVRGLKVRQPREQWVLRRVVDLSAEDARGGVRGPTRVSGAGEPGPCRPHRARQRASVVVEPGERVPTVDEVPERERDVDPVARADLWTFPGEAVREGGTVRRG